MGLGLGLGEERNSSVLADWPGWLVVNTGGFRLSAFKSMEERG